MKQEKNHFVEKEFTRIHNTLTAYIEQMENQLDLLKTNQLRLELLKYSPKLYNEFKKKRYLEDYNSIINHLELTDYEILMKNLSFSLNLPGITEFISYWMDVPLHCFHKSIGKKQILWLDSFTKNTSFKSDIGNHLLVDLGQNQYLKAMLISDTFARFYPTLQKTLLSDQRRRRCHDISMHLAHAIDGKVLTGLVNLPYYYFVHSVVEKNGYILDTTQNFVMKKEDYLKLFQFEPIHCIEKVDDKLLKLNEKSETRYYIPYQEMIKTMIKEKIDIPKPKTK